MQIMSNYSNSQNNVKFGRITKEAKMVINYPAVRTILEREHSIGRKQIRNMDGSLLRIDLFSSAISRPGDAFQLSELSGLTIKGPKGKGLNYQVITRAEDGMILEPSHKNFAEFVSIAYDMVKVHNSTLKELGFHAELKKMAPQFAKLRREFNTTIGQFVRGHGYDLEDKNLGQIREKLNTYTNVADETYAKIAGLRETSSTDIAKRTNEQWSDLFLRAS